MPHTKSLNIAPTVNYNIASTVSSHSAPTHLAECANSLFATSLPPQTAVLPDAAVNNVPAATNNGPLAFESPVDIPQTAHITELSSSASPSLALIIEPKIEPEAEENIPAIEPAEEPPLSTGPENTPDPLFLPSPESSGSPEIEPITVTPSPKKAEKPRNALGPTPGLEIYVEIPYPPWHRKRRRIEDLAKMKRITKTNRTMVIKESEDEDEELRDPKGKGKEREREEKRPSLHQVYKRQIEQQAIPLSVSELIELARPKTAPSEAPHKPSWSGMR